MAVAANALVTLAVAKSYLNVTGTGSDADIELVIDRASDWIEGFCGRPFKEIAYTTLRLRGPRGSDLFVAHAPIKTSATVTIKVDGTTQTVWKAEADGDPKDFDVIVARSTEWSVMVPDLLYRDEGWAPESQSNPFNVLLTYTGGLLTIPDDIQEACLLCVQKIFREQQRQLAELATVNLPGGGVTLFDRAMPARARELLNSYRRLAVA